MDERRKSVLAIDPGRAKCGVAVVRRSGPDSLDVLHQRVVSTADLPAVLTDLTTRFSPDAVIVGNGTTADRALEAARRSTGLDVQVVDEKFTSLLARKRFFQENPPRGLRKLIPVSLQTPPRPIDDYVAVILAERYLLT